MKNWMITLVCAASVVAVAGGSRGETPKSAAVAGGASKGSGIKRDPAPYCNRGGQAPFCPKANLKTSADEANKGLKREIAKHKKAVRKGLKVFGLDGWQEMYLEGQGLEGRHFALATSRPQVFPLKTGDILVDSNNCEAPSLQLTVSDCDGTDEPSNCRVTASTDSGANVCGQGAGVPVGVQIVKGFWDGSGKWNSSDTELTLSCNADGNEANNQLPAGDGAVARCIRYYNYMPRNGNDDLTSCIRMQRADFCGNDTSMTYVGTFIDAHDKDDKIDSKKCGDGMCFEASWSKDGAVCVGHARWTNLDYSTACGDTFPDLVDGVHCRPGKKIDNNALFTRSKLNTCGQKPTSCGPDTVSPGCPKSAGKKKKD